RARPVGPAEGEWRAGDAGRWHEAARDYAALLAIDPGNAAARNHLASMLAEGQCFVAAAREARAALAAIAPQSPLRPAILDSVETIARSTGGADAEPDYCAEFD